MRTLIHAYEMDQLPESERDAFEEHLFGCEFCLAEVQAMQPLSSAVLTNREAVLEALREDGLTFDNLRRRLRTRPQSAWEKLGEFARGWYGRAVLTGATAMAILLGFLMKPQPGISPFLADLSFEVPPYQNHLQLRGGTEDEAGKLFASAMEFYVQGNYTAASSGIKHSLNLDPTHADRWLYLGASRYAMKDTKAAIRYLKQAERLGDGLTKLRAQWYLAQSYLLHGKVDRARELLESVAAQNSEHADDAKLLLVRISERERQR